MDEPLFSDLPLPEQAARVRENGRFIEAQDFYSFFIHIYLLNQDYVKLFYDFSGALVSIEREEEPNTGNFLSTQLESKI